METFYGDTNFWSEAAEPAKDLGQLLRDFEYSNATFIVDRNISLDWLPQADLAELRATVESHEGGEEIKTFSSLARFVSMHEDRFDKDSIVIAVGGGAMLDFIGLCCGLMYRGIRYLSVPTSVIAMADAAYGGKTAVNHGAKNQIGMYHHARLVYVNPVFLRSLPALHYRSGMVEIVKLAIFHPELRAILAAVKEGETTAGQAALAAARLKLRLLESDPHEQLNASVLLYGHPFANAFETYHSERHGDYLAHGDAVALGISFSAWLTELSLGQAGRAERELALLSGWSNPADTVTRSTPADSAAFLQYLGRDKFASGGLIRVPALCDTPGHTVVTLETVADSYDAWRTWLTGGVLAASKAPAAPDADLVTHSYIAGRPDDETVGELKFVRADGPFLITDSGARILDWSTCLNAPLGHSMRIETSHLPVNAGNYRTSQRDALVGRLKQIYPYLDGFQFRSSGTEAVEAAARYVAKAVGSDAHTFAVEGCYHGLTLGAQFIMGTAAAVAGQRTELPFGRLGDGRYLTDVFEAALQVRPVVLWLEGVQGATLRRLPASFLELAGDLQARYPGRMVIACDDMLASVRTGDWCSLRRMQPDLLVAGKSWASGYPFSFFGVRAWLRAAAGDVLGTTSYGGNPIACAYASHTVDRLTGLITRIRAVESRFAPQLRTGTSDLVTRSEWHGMLFGLELASQEDAMTAAGQAAASGLLVSRLGRVLRCSPPLNATDEQLASGLAVLLNSLS